MATNWNMLAAPTMGVQPTLNDYLKGNTPIPEGGSVSRGESGQSYAFGDTAKQVAGSAAGSTQMASQELMKLLANPTAHPAYATSLKGVLESMRPQVEQGYSDLSDAFRNAGALQSGAYGTSLAKYAGEVNRNETIAASDVLSKLLPTLVQGYGSQAGQAPSLLDALKLSKQSNIQVSNGANGSGSGSGGNSYMRYDDFGSKYDLGGGRANSAAWGY